MNRSTIHNFAQYWLAILFAWSAGGKILWPRSFAQLTEGLGLVPGNWVYTIAYVLPTLELAISLGLLIARYRFQIVAAGTAAFLCLVFTGIHVYVLATGTPVPCGCAGIALTAEGRSSHVVMLLVSCAMGAASCYLLTSRNTANAAESFPRAADDR